MTPFTTAALAAAALLLAAPALADTIRIDDAYARAATPTSKSGAAFMEITNTGPTDDRLVAAASGIATRVELHTHVTDGDVMRMMKVEDGFPVPAGETIRLERGGKHVMFMGLSAPMTEGATVAVTLTFEAAGDIEVEIPVDLKRQPQGHGG